ncbi:hypothetical protein [Desulfoluna spongiiphila]|nr:hypothetical protein [Desulfoluna spongiiphila]
MQRPVLILIVLFVLPLFSACSLFSPHPVRFEQDGAEEELMRLSRLNEGVTTFKGTGSVVTTDKGETRRFRIAWAGAAPNLLRLEIIASATPVESLAYDGTRLRLRSNVGSHAPYAKKVEDPSLARATGIPLTLSEIHALLSGKFLVGPFESARLLTPDQGPETLVLRPDRSRTKTITLNAHRLPTRATLSKAGKTIYDLRLTPKADPGGTNRFRTIELTTAKGVSATIRIDRMFVNPSVDQTIFTLEQ